MRKWLLVLPLLLVFVFCVAANQAAASPLKLTISIKASGEKYPTSGPSNFIPVVVRLYQYSNGAFRPYAAMPIVNFNANPKTFYVDIPRESIGSFMVTATNFFLGNDVDLNDPNNHNTANKITHITNFIGNGWQALNYDFNISVAPQNALGVTNWRAERTTIGGKPGAKKLGKIAASVKLNPPTQQCGPVTNYLFRKVAASAKINLEGTPVNTTAGGAQPIVGGDVWEKTTLVLDPFPGVWQRRDIEVYYFKKAATGTLGQIILGPFYYEPPLVDKGNVQQYQNMIQ